MPLIIFRGSQYTIGQGHDLGDVYAGVANGLPKLGFINVRNEGYIVADKGPMTLEVRFLQCNANTFWQVVIGATDGPQADGDADIANVLTMISQLTFL